MAGNPHVEAATARARRVRKPRRRRPVCALRGQSASTVRKTVRTTGFRVKGPGGDVHTQSLRHVFHVLEQLGSGQELPTVHVRVHDQVNCNLVALRRTFGSSTVRVTLWGGMTRTLKLSVLLRVHLSRRAGGNKCMLVRKFRVLKLRR